MKGYRVIVGLALLPRALHVAGSMLLVLGVVVWLVIPTMCSAVLSSSPAAQVDAGRLEPVIADKTAELGPPPAEPVCFASDVKALCCPSACAVKASPKWMQADQVLRSCMRGLGCSDSESKGATVFNRCNCGRAKP